MKIPADMQVGMKHKTKTSGIISILEYNSSSDVVVMFEDTGKKKTTRTDKIRNGWVKDVFAKSVCGVGYFGDGPYKSKLNGRHTACYRKWRAMIARCYSEYNLSIKPTYSECTVCDEWHNFQRFASWFNANYPSDGKDYELDKDITSGTKRGSIYSPSTCKFVTGRDNIQHSHSKSYKLISPNGELVSVDNLAKFCRDNNLTDSLVHHVISGLQSHHKGWKVAN